jgi:hypothetical protein
MIVAFRLRFPKPTDTVDIQTDMNKWLEEISGLNTFDRWHWNPLGITQPQFRDWELQIPDEEISVTFKIRWSEYVTDSRSIK